MTAVTTKTTGPLHRVFLVPGFFGFSSLGDLPYFAYVEEGLTRALDKFGVRAEVHPVHSHPTASVRHRAVLLLETILDKGGDNGEPIHIIGHSTGGLDARLMMTPGVSLPTDLDPELVASRVRSVTCLSTPHRGTPVAAFFTGLMGDRLLQLFSIMTMHTVRFGRMPISVVARLAGIFARVQSGRLTSPSSVEEMHKRLLADFEGDRRTVIETFLKDVRQDQGLLPQLTPHGMDLFNASTGDRPGVVYTSVLTAGRPPGVGTTVAAGLDPYMQATHALYTVLYKIAGRPSSGLVGRGEPGLEQEVRRRYGEGLAANANDGVVPTRSQVWGDVVYAAQADHLDVIGYFNQPKHDPPHYDWLSSASGFRRAEFDALWESVARTIAGSGTAPATAPEGGASPTLDGAGGHLDPTLRQPWDGAAFAGAARAHLTGYALLGLSTAGLSFLATLRALSHLRVADAPWAQALVFVAVYLALAVAPLAAYERWVPIFARDGRRARALSVLRGIYRVEADGALLWVPRFRRPVTPEARSAG